MKKHYTLLLILVSILSLKVFSQNTVISYQGIPSTVPTACFFNNPSPSIAIGGFPHVGVVGGVEYTGNEFELLADVSGQGTGFGIYYGFQTGYKYKVVATAKSTSPTVKLQCTTNSSRTNIPSSCSPGFPNYILSGQDKNGSVTSMNNTFTDYTLLDNYQPSQSGINYLLFSNYNTATNPPSNTSTSINKIQILTNGCRIPTSSNYGFIPYGAGNMKVQFTPPTGSIVPITSYTVRVLRFLPVAQSNFRLITGMYEFNNVSNGQMINIPNGGTATYAMFYLVSKCNSVETSTDGYLTVVI